jgi:glycosyltransferase involved in cell wall biosynthesis
LRWLYQSRSTDNSMDESILISVVIPTVGRRLSIIETVESILRNDYADREVIVVDQSGDGFAEECLRSYVEAAQVRYLRAPQHGVAFSRNRGASEAKGSLVAYTDDDCVVSPTWLSDVARAFRVDDRIAMVFGNVQAGAHRRDLGFVQAYVRSEPFLATNASEKYLAEGIGGCMAVKKTVWEELQGFDLALGAGSTFRSAEETDFAFRVLLAGYFVYETPEVSVVHRGFRSWVERPRVIRDYLYGLGAMSAKHLKCCNWKVLNLMFHYAFRWAFKGPVVDLGGRPPRIPRLHAYLNGLATGAATHLDRKKALYRAYSTLTEEHLPAAGGSQYNTI